MCGNILDVWPSSWAKINTEIYDTQRWFAKGSDMRWV